MCSSDLTHPDLRGLYVAGGGITGALAAIRDLGRSGQQVVVGYDVMESTKAGLLDGSLSLVIANPFERIAHETIEALVRVASQGPDVGRQSVQLPLEIYTSENL